VALKTLRKHYENTTKFSLEMDRWRGGRELKGKYYGMWSMLTITKILSANVERK
jgi:hypothetical protein